jgi:arsenate reductase-like glutaredoxin family protein
MIVYGIASCDTCRKARAALAAAGHDVTFRDIRAEPLAKGEREEFVAAFGDAILNRASATWRGLAAEERSRPAGELLAAHPTLMKRPMIRAGDALHLGWGLATQRALLT